MCCARVVQLYPSNVVDIERGSWSVFLPTYF